MTGHGEQVNAALRSVEAFDSPALTGDAFAKDKVSTVLDKNRQAEGEVIDRAIGFSGAVGDAVTPYDPGNPDHQSAPFVVFAADPDTRYVCRAPLLLAHLVVGISCASSRTCDWHDGPCEPSSSGVHQWSLLTIARGQFLVAFAVCSSCRESLQSVTRAYGHDDDATLRNGDGIEGIPTAEWHRYSPKMVNPNIFDVGVLWRGLQWTLPLEVTQSRNPVTDPRAWDRNPD